MLAHLQKLSLLVILIGISGIAMMPPAVYAYLSDDMHSARVFLYGAVLVTALAALIGTATANNPQRSIVRSHLLALVATYLMMPVLLALPFYEVVQNTRFVNAYFEMLSALTTTGATIFDDPERLPNAAHLWRAIVGWLGGLFIWITAIAILAPMNLGGFEVTARGNIGTGETTLPFASAKADPAKRLTRHAIGLVPIYVGLTGALWLFLTIVGETPFIAVCHAMSTLSTSGITPVSSFTEGSAGFPGEILLFIFMFFAISRITFAPETQTESLRRLAKDPEFRLGIFCLLIVTGLLFLRHLAGAHDVGTQKEFGSAISAAWGSMFTAMSFLTTTGFESAHWEASRFWSGLEAPGIILIGLALMGGGIATTAGGLKLLRLYALSKHGSREMGRLIYPSSVAGRGTDARHLRNQGAYKAWVFVMIFFLSLAGVMAALALTGLSFEHAAIMAIAALTTTGPLVHVATDNAIAVSSLSDGGKAVLGAAMILGRLETLAIIAFLSPEFWRD